MTLADENTVMLYSHVRIECRHQYETVPAQPEAETLSLNHARKLFFLSFEHSQGNTSLQKMIFDYLHHLHPNWTIDADFKAELSNAVTQPIINYALPQPGKRLLHSADAEVAALDKGGMLNEVKEQLHTMQHSFNRTPGDPPQLLHIAATIINRDLNYLEKSRPRSTHSSKHRLMPKADPWLSYFVYHGLDGHPTGAIEYDRMYNDVVATVENTFNQKHHPSSLSDNIYTELHHVIECYYQKHPNEIVPSSTEMLLQTLADQIGHI